MRSIDRFALSFSPILLRLALGLTFLWAGAGKLFLTTELGPEQAATLAEIRAGAAPASAPDPEDAAPNAAPDQALPESQPSESRRNGNLRSLTDRPANQQENQSDNQPGDRPSDQSGESPADDASDDEEPNRPDPSAAAPDRAPAPGYSVALVQDQDQTETETEPSAADDDDPASTVAAKERMLVSVALTIHGAVHPEKGSPRLPAFMASNAIAFAWAVALVEFLGGICMILGLLTRLWALGLTGVMAGVVWISEIGPAAMGAMDQTFLGFLPPVWPFNPATGMHFFWTLGLLLTAFAMVFLGAGALSLDRLLFGNPSKNTYETFKETGAPA